MGKISTFTFENISTSHTIQATFNLNSYIITPTASDNGTITPSEPQILYHGDGITFTITADEGYHIEDILK